MCVGCDVRCVSLPVSDRLPVTGAVGGTGSTVRTPGCGRCSSEGLGSPASGSWSVKGGE